MGGEGLGREERKGEGREGVGRLGFNVSFNSHAYSMAPQD